MRIMRNVTKILISVLLISICHSVTGQVSLKHFFKPRPTKALGQDEFGLFDAKWDLKPIAQVPAIKIIESNRDGAELDAFILASAGGGITLQTVGQKDGKNYSKFSWSPITILLTGDTSKDGAVLDLSWVSTVGFFNNLLQIGVGRDFGEIPTERSRWFGVLSLGVNLTNNGKAPVGE